MDARERAPCPPSRQRAHLQLSGSSSVAEKLAVCPEEASPLSPRPGVQTKDPPIHRPRACGCHCVAPRLFAFHSGLYLKTRKKREKRRKQPRSNVNSGVSLSALPSEAALCVWDVAAAVMGIPAVTLGSGGDRCAARSEPGPHSARFFWRRAS